MMAHGQGAEGAPEGESIGERRDEIAEALHDAHIVA